MESKQEIAASLFRSGFNCSQSVFAVFAEQYGINQETALKLTCGLGGGVRSGEICGAVSGAVLVVGLKYGHYQAEDTDSKSLCYAKTAEFLERFRAINSSIVCRDLLGYDISKKEEYEAAKNKNLFQTTCVAMVKSAVSLLEELGY